MPRPEEEEDDDRLYEPEEENAELGEPAEDEEEEEYQDEDEEEGLSGVEEDANAAFEEQDEAAAKQNAGEAPVSVDDEPDHEEQPETIRPGAQPAQDRSDARGTTARPVMPNGAPQTQQRPAAAPRAGVTIQRPVKDEDGKTVGFEELDASGAVIDEYMVDASGNRIDGKPWWNEEGVTQTVVANESEGLIRGGFAVGGLIAGWIGKSLWDDYQKKKKQGG